MTSATKESGRDGNGSDQKGGSFDEAATGRVEERLFTSDFVFATLANFVNAFGVQMLAATVPVYVISLGGNQTDAGLVTGTMAFTALLFRLSWAI